MINGSPAWLLVRHTRTTTESFASFMSLYEEKGFVLAVWKSHAHPCFLAVCVGRVSFCLVKTEGEMWCILVVLGVSVNVYNTVYLFSLVTIIRQIANSCFYLGSKHVYSPAFPFSIHFSYFPFWPSSNISLSIFSLCQTFCRYVQKTLNVYLKPALETISCAL